MLGQESELVRMPNGPLSWAETHYLIVDLMVIVEANKTPEHLKKLREDGGTMAICELTITLTTNFEEKFEGEKWEDKDWYIEVEDYFTEMISNEEKFLSL
jgi:hypothetical protein